jgi:hypothetical protein
MSKKTIISLVVILLIFIYWRKKRPSGSACADLWKDISNASAEQLYYEAINLADNDADVNVTLTDLSLQRNENIDYLKCKYAVDYIYRHNDPVAIITKGEAEKIKTCICDKFNS